jgi:hypothetical protein
VIILLMFLVIALVFGFGFALNWLWFVAVFFLIFWLVGIAFGRREPIGRHRFYRW